MTDATRSEDLGSVGMCMSGGGYRAAAFHLGALAYLDHVGLAERLGQISTVSGGTFTGARYALSLVEKQSFDDFFRAYWAFLRDKDLVRLGLRELAAGRPDVPSGRHDLIVSMASVYAREFLSDPEGVPYRFGALLDADIRLGDVILNSTEFRHGLAFRFQRSSDPAAPIGNELLRLRREHAAEIRVADIVAASSCFPGGFEPLAFPYDFVWPGGVVPPEVEREFTRDGKHFPVALMDGGIFDNQGVQSLLLADEHVPGTGLLIMSDVDQLAQDLYPFPVQDVGGGGPTLARVRLYAVVLLVLAVASVGAMIFHAWREQHEDGLDSLDILVYAVPSVLAASVAYALWWMLRTLDRRLLPAIPRVREKGWKELKRLRINRLLHMVHLRLSSLLALTSSIFMRRVRDLVDAPLRADPRYRHRLVSNEIEDLAGEGWSPELPASVPRPSPALRRVTDTAALMPTTLWFDEGYQLPTLVASGQATLCFNLMVWIACNNSEGPPYTGEVGELWKRLVADWETLNAEPYALLHRRLGEGHLEPPPGGGHVPSARVRS